MRNFTLACALLVSSNVLAEEPADTVKAKAEVVPAAADGEGVANTAKGEDAFVEPDVARQRARVKVRSRVEVVDPGRPTGDIISKMRARRRQQMERRRRLPPQRPAAERVRRPGERPMRPDRRPPSDRREELREDKESERPRPERKPPRPPRDPRSSGGPERLPPPR